MKHRSNPAHHRVDSRSATIKLLISPSLSRQNAAAQIPSQRHWSNLLEVVVDAARAAQRIHRVRASAGYIGILFRRRSYVTESIYGEHTVGAKLRVSGAGTDKGSDSKKKENCFAETHVPLVY